MSARQQIVAAARDAGWTPDKGCDSARQWAGSKDGDRISLEFSAKTGGIISAYASRQGVTGSGRYVKGTGRLARVLSFMETGQLVADPAEPALDWLADLRQRQAEGASFGSALAEANKTAADREAGS